MISNLSTQRLPQSISVSLISPYLGPQILRITMKEFEESKVSIDKRSTGDNQKETSCTVTYLGLRRSVWDFLSSGGLCGEDVPPGSSGGRGKSVRSWRAFLSDFFFPESELSFELTARKHRRDRVSQDNPVQRCIDLLGQLPQYTLTPLLYSCAQELFGAMGEMR